MFFTYILYSKEIDKFYIGATSNIQERITKHNTNHKGFTGKTNDWKLVHKEEFDTKSEAIKRELKIKKWKSRKMIMKLINQ